MGFLNLFSKPAPATVELNALLAEIGAPTVPSKRERQLLTETLQAPPQRSEGQPNEASLNDCIGRLADKSPLNLVEVASLALDCFWHGAMPLKSAGLNLAGAAFYDLGWMSEAIEHYALATTLGHTREQMKANVDEVRATARVEPSITDEQLVHTALVGRQMRRMLLDTSDVFGTSLMRAEMFLQAGLPTFAMGDLRRAFAANPKAGVIRQRLVSAAAALGNEAAGRLLPTVPAASLDGSVRLRITGFVAERMEPEVAEHFDKLLEKWR